MFVGGESLTTSDISRLLLLLRQFMIRIVFIVDVVIELVDV